MTMPLPEQWCFDPGEKVVVSLPDSAMSIPGTFVERVETQGSYCAVDTAEGLKLFSPIHILKHVIPGDFVKILAGHEAGKEGFVISRNEALLSIAPGHFGVDAVSDFNSG
jgi:hypothetical protein